MLPSRSGRKHTAITFAPQYAILGLNNTVDGDFVPLLGMADVIDQHVIMLAPEDRDRIVSLGDSFKGRGNRSARSRPLVIRFDDEE